jgi:phosphatidylinositol alpha-1,6-mannosyltransferase
MVFLEAAACGKTAIAGRAGGTEDAVLDGETGLRVDAVEERAVAEAISSLLSDPARRRAQGDAALARARRDYGWASVAARIDALAADG